MVNYLDFNNNFELTKFPILSSVYSRSRNYIRGSNSIFSDFTIPINIQRFSPYVYTPQNGSITDSQFIGSFQLELINKRKKRLSYWGLQADFGRMYSRRYLEFVLSKNYWRGFGIFKRINKSGFFFNFPHNLSSSTVERKFIIPLVNKNYPSVAAVQWAKRNAAKGKVKLNWPVNYFMDFCLGPTKKVSKSRGLKVLKRKRFLNIRRYFGLYSSYYKIFEVDESSISIHNWKKRFDKEFFTLNRTPNLETYPVSTTGYFPKSLSLVWIRRLCLRIFKYNILDSGSFPRSFQWSFGSKINFNVEFFKYFQKYIYGTFNSFIVFSGRMERDLFPFDQFTFEFRKLHNFFSFFYNSAASKVIISNLSDDIVTYTKEKDLNEILKFKSEEMPGGLVPTYSLRISSTFPKFSLDFPFHYGFLNRTIFPFIQTKPILRRFPWRPGVKQRSLQFTSSYRYLRFDSKSG